MDKLEAVERFIFLVKQIPDDRMEKIIAMVEDYLEEQGVIIIEPFDRSTAKPEFLQRLDEAREEARQGDLISHEEVRREIFGQ
ncbi:MAG: hypothetical protein AB9903_02085 [Vulcanimicrobiota bacterium]